jgi:hypothetical protein
MLLRSGAGWRPVEYSMVALRIILREQRCGEQQAGDERDCGEPVIPGHNHYSVVNLF